MEPRCEIVLGTTPSCYCHSQTLGVCQIRRDLLRITSYSDSYCDSPASIPQIIRRDGRLLL